MRPEGWEKLGEHRCSGDGCLQCRDVANREAGADAYEELIKKDALYGESGEDFLIASKVKLKDKDWAEPFFKTLEGKGHLVFIKEL